MELQLIDGREDRGGESTRPLSFLDLLAADLRSKLTTCVTDRSVVEQRWVESLQQYLGEYDEVTLKNLQANDRSSVFLNITRVIVNQSEAQLADLLFPAEDKNYGLSPTPNPELDQGLADTSPVVNPLTGEAIQDPNTLEPVTNAEVAAEAQRIAADKAKAMEREIDDQLVECDHAAEARKALHWATIFGTGILIGPEAQTRTTQRYEMPASPESGAGTVMSILQTTRPGTRAVAPWDFYPDMSGSSIKEAEFVFERSFMTAKQVRSLAKKTSIGYQRDRIQALLMTMPQATHVSAAGHVDELRRLTGADHSVNNTRYEVWTYRGPIDKDSLIEAGLALDPDDPLQVFDGVVVFSGDQILKVALNPLESEEWPYAVWCWQEDDFCIFGFGVPWLCRNEQRIVNAAWRMMLDNAAKSAGPQVVAKRHALAPADGSNEITPWKLWWADESITDVRTAFTVFTFPSVQTEVANILQLAKSFLVETAGLPPPVGQGNGQVPTTLGGMAMLMNSSNTDRRRQVRAWDDNVTKPLIRRFYHWNMQYSDKEEVKGDFEVHARGSSALLLREQQALNLMGLLDKYAAHPTLMPVLKSNAALRKLVQALHISPDELVKTDEELAAEAAKAQETGDAMDPQVVIEQMRSEQIAQRAQFSQELESFKAQFEREEREADRQMRRELAVLEAQKLDRQLQMEAMKLAQTTDTNYQKILADLKKHRWRLNLDKARFEKEVQLKLTKGVHSNYGLDDS